MRGDKKQVSKIVGNQDYGEEISTPDLQYLLISRGFLVLEAG